MRFLQSNLTVFYHDYSDVKHTLLALIVLLFTINRVGFLHDLTQPKTLVLDATEKDYFSGIADVFLP